MIPMQRCYIELMGDENGTFIIEVDNHTAH